MDKYGGSAGNPYLVEQDQNSEKGGLFTALMLLLLGIAALALATLSSERVNGQYVVIAPPGTSQAATFAMVASVDGLPVALGGFGNVIIAASDRTDFVADMENAGAWAVFPAPRFLGCSTPTPEGSV
ncbi:hypothetical protein [Paracoccus laeviglucosivorans]|uniref:Uncharacterized protein n=1 Tax=Paracoccus laeviglucosivorans TaxID=1197861 RepID=A0A521ELV1_9RHOB|nr:hypothetical protein [Paracoccus laeviglucosivorans]SMO84888.1 hypothetical protein SAMN06265221_11419 [Paracoccus laeviglucosivorans]